MDMSAHDRIQPFFVVKLRDIKIGRIDIIHAADKSCHIRGARVAFKHLCAVRSALGLEQTQQRIVDIRSPTAPVGPAMQGSRGRGSSGAPSPSARREGGNSLAGPARPYQRRNCSVWVFRNGSHTSLTGAAWTPGTGWPASRTATRRMVAKIPGPG